MNLTPVVGLVHSVENCSIIMQNWEMLKRDISFCLFAIARKYGQSRGWRWNAFHSSMGC